MLNFWKEIYPNSAISEQRICDQKIFSKAKDNSNLHGNWLTTLEIDLIKQVTEETSKRNGKNELNTNKKEANEYDKGVMLGDNVSTPDTYENEYYCHIIENDMVEGNELLKRLIDKYEKAKITPIRYRQCFKKPHKKDEKKLIKASEG